MAYKMASKENMALTRRRRDKSRLYEERWCDKQTSPFSLRLCGEINYKLNSYKKVADNTEQKIK